MDINQIMASLEAKHPGESEYLQAVRKYYTLLKTFTTNIPNLKKLH